VPPRASGGGMYGLLRSAGDARALVLDCNRQLREWKLPPVVSYQGLCQEIAGMSFGELDMVGARSVTKRYSDEWFEAARRRKAGEDAGFPRRKRALLSVRWYHGTFRIDGDRLRIPVARGAPLLVVRLERSVPYPQESIRSLTLLAEAGRLYVDVTAALSPEDHDLDPRIVAGVDPGIIHPFAVVLGDEALLVSGRAMRSECHLHLADTKARARRMGRKAPSRGQRGSRRWRKLRRTQRRQEARHRRRIRQAHHEAAKVVVTWAVDHKVGTLRVGDPEGICNRDGPAPEPAPSQLGPHPSHRGSEGQGRDGGHRGSGGRRAGELLDLPGVPEEGPQAQRKGLHLSALWIQGAPGISSVPQTSPLRAAG
jgi:transposase